MQAVCGVERVENAYGSSLTCRKLSTFASHQMTLAELHEMLSEVLATVLEPVLRVLVSVHSVFTPLARPELTRQYADRLLLVNSDACVNIPLCSD